MLHMNVYPHHPLYHIPLRKRKKGFCDAKVIEGSEAPEGLLRVFFRFHNSDRVLFRYLGDRALLMVLSDGVFFRVLSNRFLGR